MKNEMDIILSEFVTRTSVEPGLATDLLNAHDWNLQAALSAYYVMKGILPGEVPPLYHDSPLSKSHVDTTSQRSKHLFEESCLKESVPGELYDNRNEPQDEGSKKLTRGFSRAIDNFVLVNQARNEFAHDFFTLVQEENVPLSRLEIPDNMFTIPDFSVYPAQLRDFLHKDLIETSTLVSLEEAGRLNWWHEKQICQKLWPLATTGDGNCLLHAASLGMWGFHDRLLTLRKALHALMTNSHLTEAFYRRWRWQTFKQNKEAGLIYCEEEWEKEWQSLLKISSTEPRTKYSHSNSTESSSSSNDDDRFRNAVYESLEELHVFGLAHVLRRPIVVIADTLLKDIKGEPFAPIPFGGIYLPLECSSSECHRSPLCLTYDSAHFSALVPMNNTAEELLQSKVPTAIPVTDPENKLLHLHFAVDPGPEVQWDQDEHDSWVVARLTLSDEDKLLLLNEYLDVRSFPVASPQENNISSSLNHYSAGKHINQEVLYDSDDSLTSSGISCTGGKNPKSKAAKQLQTVAKQFGSIGKSVSKKLKHIGDMARRGGSFKSEPKAFRQVSNLKNKRNLSGLPMISQSATNNGICNSHQVIVALLHTEKKHEHQNQIVQNYLNSAFLRYEKEKRYQDEVSASGAVRCGNPKCLMYGVPATNYFCSSCYLKQKPYEVKAETGKRFTLQKQNKRPLKDNAVVSFGKSSFYTDAADQSSLPNVDTLEGRSSVLRWDSAEFYDNCPSKPLHSPPPYECKERIFQDKDRMLLNRLQESATS